MQVLNYYTIMVSSTIAKLYNIVMESEVNSCLYSKNKISLEQVGFRLKHYIVAHLVTIKVIIEESWLQGKAPYCCFVDFKKA